MDDLMIWGQEAINKPDVARRIVKVPSLSNLTRADTVDLANAWREITSGDVVYGARLLERVLDDLAPAWRTL